MSEHEPSNEPVWAFWIIVVVVLLGMFAMNGCAFNPIPSEDPGARIKPHYTKTIVFPDGEKTKARCWKESYGWKCYSYKDGDWYRYTHKEL